MTSEHHLFRLVTLATFLCLTFLSIQSANAQPDVNTIKLPAGFKLTIYADRNTGHGEYLANARFMVSDESGHLYVSNATDNRVLMLKDNDHDGKAEDVIIVADNLNAPQGLAFIGSSLLVANQDGVVKLDKVNGRWPAKITPLISHLATGGHALKSIKVSPDGFLFVNIGSSCNVCVENDPTRATILRYTLDGKPAGALLTLGRHQQSAIWASGLRNAQGFAWQLKTGAMYATNNGSDMRSEIKNGPVNDELPPEHLNKIEAGKHYGWPYCWGASGQENPLINNQPLTSQPLTSQPLASQVEDPNFPGEVGFCKTTQAPEITFTSHSTPIGITFLDKAHFPGSYKNDAIVALHGSWNRKQPSGYKLVRVKFMNNAAGELQAREVEDFATGWLTDKSAWGRPVDVVVGTDGDLYVSDDMSGTIYRISYVKPTNQ